MRTMHNLAWGMHVIRDPSFIHKQLSTETIKLYIYWGMCTCSDCQIVNHISGHRWCHSWTNIVAVAMLLLQSTVAAVTSYINRPWSACSILPASIIFPDQCRKRIKHKRILHDIILGPTEKWRPYYLCVDALEGPMQPYCWWKHLLATGLGKTWSLVCTICNADGHVRGDKRIGRHEVTEVREENRRRNDTDRFRHRYHGRSHAEWNRSGCRLQIAGCSVTMTQAAWFLFDEILQEAST